MHVSAAELLGRDHLAGRRLHQRRPPQEDRSFVAHDDALVRHGRHVGAAGGAGAHNNSNLRNAQRRHARLVVEDAPEVALVGKNLVLEWQECAAGIDQIDAGQMILARDILRAQVLLHRHGVVGAAFDRGVVGDDDAFAAADAADAGDYARGVHVAAIKAIAGERRKFEERRSRVEQQADPVARQQLAARNVARARLGAAALHRRFELGAQIRHQALHRLGVAKKFRRAWINDGLQDGHRLSASCRTAAGR